MINLNNIVICSILLLITFLPACTKSQEKPREITVRMPYNFDETFIQLVVKISCDKSEVSMNDSILFDVRILNLPVDDLYFPISVFNPVKLGQAGGLTITVAGPEGKEVFPKGETFDPAILPTLDDSWQYSILMANHYLGAIYKDSAENIFRGAGKYFVYAEYLSPVTKDSVKKPEDRYGIYESDPFWYFWGREIGPIRSAPLEITVTE